MAVDVDAVTKRAKKWYGIDEKAPAIVAELADIGLALKRDAAGKWVEDEVSKKANDSDVTCRLAEKAEKREVESRLKAIESAKADRGALDAKADAKDVKTLQADVAKKSDQGELWALYNELQQAIEHGEWRKAFVNSVEKIAGDFERTLTHRHDELAEQIQRVQAIVADGHQLKQHLGDIAERHSVDVQTQLKLFGNDLQAAMNGHALELRTEVQRGEVVMQAINEYELRTKNTDLVRELTLLRQAQARLFWLATGAFVVAAVAFGCCILLLRR